MLRLYKMPRLPTDYSRTLIYKIVKNDDFENANVYVGSTTEFVKRKCGHKSCCNNENSEGYNRKVYQTIRENGGWENWKMLEIEKFPCNDKREAEAREEYWRCELKAKLNTNKASITEGQRKEQIKQYQLDNADKFKQYHIDNADKFKQYRIDYLNKMKQKYNCECGKVIRRDRKEKHAKSKRHINYMNSLEN